MPRARKVQGKISRGQVSWEGATTVMVRNVSPKVSQPALRAELHARGFGVPVYDFFYLPMNSDKTANAGYAFVNFRDPSTVQLFVQAFDSTVLPGYPSRRRLQVVPASTQGYEANLSHFAHSAVLNHHDAEHAPLFLRDDRSKGGARRPARRQAATTKAAGPRTLAYNLGTEQKGATVILRLTDDAEQDGAILDSFLSESSPWHALLATGVDFQHVDSWGTGSATLHFRNEDLAFHFQRAFEHASLLVGAPPIELEVVNAKMPKSPTSFTFTPQVRMPGSPLRSPPNGPPPPPPLLEGIADDTLSPSTTPHWLQVNDQRKASLSAQGATPSSTRSENTVRAVPLDFSAVSLADRANVSPSKSEPGRRARAGTDPVDMLLSPARKTGNNTVPGSPFDLPSLLPAPRAAVIPPLPL